jgi:WXXGXW repeat (2 copies)
MRPLFIALCFAALASPLTASADVDGAVITRTIAPPLARDEPAPAFRNGYTWSPGFWDWRGTRYVWMKGEWVREKPGFTWAGWRWVEEGGRWHFLRGGYAPVKKTAPAVVASR